MKDYMLSTCPHSWIPLRRYPQMALCYYCEGRGRWSTVLGRYVRIIPESHEHNGGAPQLGNRRHYERPRA